jgi:hypothetical protein
VDQRQDEHACEHEEERGTPDEHVQSPAENRASRSNSTG